MGNRLLHARRRVKPVCSDVIDLIPTSPCYLDSASARWHDKTSLISYPLSRRSLPGHAVLEGRVECSIAKALEPRFVSVAGFGCSGCKCSSHLFFTTREDDMKETIEISLPLTGCPYRTLERKDIPRYLGLR